MRCKGVLQLSVGIIAKSHRALGQLGSAHSLPLQDRMLSLKAFFAAVCYSVQDLNRASRALQATVAAVRACGFVPLLSQAKCWMCTGALEGRESTGSVHQSPSWSFRLVVKKKK